MKIMLIILITKEKGPSIKKYIPSKHFILGIIFVAN